MDKNLHDKQRYERLQRATPIWVNRVLMNQIYAYADFLTRKNRRYRNGKLLKSVKYVVDHIIPLQGQLVCGLHVPENLRVIPQTTNFRKYNHFDPDQPIESYNHDPIVQMAKRKKVKFIQGSPVFI